MSTNAAPATAKRRFAFVQGTNNMFSELSVPRADVSLAYGRIGAAGQARRNLFPNPTDAQKHAEKLILEKSGNGYVEAA